MAGETKYARSGNSHIAYRVFGDGPHDVLVIPGTISHVELYWELPANAYLLKRLTQFGRVIVFDKRGQGLSDRTAEHTLDERVGDVRAVMSAVGCQRAAIYGWSEGGQLSLMLAHRYPELVSHLVLFGSYASVVVPQDLFEAFLTTLEKHWGEGILVAVNAPSRRDDVAFVQWFGRLERSVASPGSIVALFRANQALDVRAILPDIRVPTLILHRKDDALVPVAQGRYLAEQIPGAKFIELPGADHLLQALDQPLLERMLDDIEMFITGGLTPTGRQRSETPCGARVAPRDTPASEETIQEIERYRELLGAGNDAEALAAIVSRAEAVAAAGRGEWSDAEVQFIEAARTFRRYGMVWQEAQTFQRWGQALLDAGPLSSAPQTRVQRPPNPDASLRADEHPREPDLRQSGAAPEPHTLHAIFRREGDYWTIAWQGRVVRMKHAKGFSYIARLLANPGCDVLARILVESGMTTASRSSRNAQGPAAPRRTSPEPLLDAKAREQYRVRMRDLADELAEAERLNDLGRADQLSTEFEALRDLIAAATGLGGRSRTTPSDDERARLMVTKAIKSALARIRTNESELGHHLATSIRTGNLCSYQPGPSPPAWEL